MENPIKNGRFGGKTHYFWISTHIKLAFQAPGGPFTSATPVLRLHPHIGGTLTPAFGVMLQFHHGRRHLVIKFYHHFCRKIDPKSSQKPSKTTPTRFSPPQKHWNLHGSPLSPTSSPRKNTAISTKIHRTKVEKKTKGPLRLAWQPHSLVPAKCESLSRSGTRRLTIRQTKMVDRRYIFKLLFFLCHVGFRNISSLEVGFATGGFTRTPTVKGGEPQKNCYKYIGWFFFSRIARNIMKYHEISWNICLMHPTTVPIQSIYGNSAYSHGNSVKNPATYHLILFKEYTSFQIPNSSKNQQINLAIFDPFHLFPISYAANVDSASAIDWYPVLVFALLSRHLLGLFPRCQCCPKWFPPSLFTTFSQKRSPPQSRCPKRFSKKVILSWCFWIWCTPQNWRIKSYLQEAQMGNGISQSCWKDMDPRSAQILIMEQS